MKEEAVQAVIEQYYEQFGAMVGRRCKALLKNEERARDAVQEVFVRILTRKDPKPIQYPSSYLYRTATSVCLRMIRDDMKQGSGSGDALLEQIASAEAVEDQTLVKDLLDRAFGREPESTRTITVMHYIDGLTYEQVAEEVGMSVSGVRKRLRKLKSIIQTFEESTHET